MQIDATGLELKLMLAEFKVRALFTFFHQYFGGQQVSVDSFDELGLS